MRALGVKPVLFILGIAALLVGCGGSAETTSSMTKAQFIQRADAICEQADKEQEELLQEFASLNSEGVTSKAAQTEIVEVVGLPPLKAQTDAISELDSPEGDEGQVEELAAGFEDALAEAEEDPLRMTKEPNGPYASVNKLAAAYGLKACADAA
jgi:hypothetical protein